MQFAVKVFLGLALGQNLYLLDISFTLLEMALFIRKGKGLTLQQWANVSVNLNITGRFSSFIKINFQVITSACDHTDRCNIGSHAEASNICFQPDIAKLCPLQLSLLGCKKS